MENQNLMLQATHPTEYPTGNLLPELVELSENDLRLICGGNSEAEIGEFAKETETDSEEGIDESDFFRIRWPRIRIKITIKW
jgi:hypothetical protein